MRHKLFKQLSLALFAFAVTAPSFAGVLTGGNSTYTGHGPAWSETTSATNPYSGLFTNGFFTLNYLGDGATGFESMQVLLGSLDMGIVMDGIIGNDRFDNVATSDTTYDDQPWSYTAQLSDSELNALLSAVTVSVTLTDLNAPSDWIDWTTTYGWSLSFDNASRVPAPSTLVLLAGLLGIVALRLKRTTDKA